MDIKFALITSATEITFDGDEAPTLLNRYYRNTLYTPQIGDRVYFLINGNTKILQGKVVK